MGVSALSGECFFLLIISWELSERMSHIELWRWQPHRDISCLFVCLITNFSFFDHSLTSYRPMEVATAGWWCSLLVWSQTLTTSSILIDKCTAGGHGRMVVVSDREARRGWGPDFTSSWEQKHLSMSLLSSLITMKDILSIWFPRSTLWLSSV